jgi:hypothetical protein
MKIAQLAAIFQCMNKSKLSQYLTALPSHFDNIFLKSFGLLPNLMRNYGILQY